MRLLATVGLCVCLAVTPTFSSVALAQEADTGVNLEGDMEDQPGCHDGKVIGVNLVSKVCWECVFPIILGMVPLNSADNGLLSTKRMPDGAPELGLWPMCMCWDDDGLPRFGTRTSMWQPARMIEHQRMSGCSSVLGGMRFPFDRLNQGNDDRFRGRGDREGKTFRHYHWFTFPLMIMMDMFVPSYCNPGGYIDLDIMYLSEIDPTWNHDEIAFFTHPEAAMIASPLGVIACIPDSFGAMVGKPIKQLYWCAGTWGVIYPTSGNAVSQDTIITSTSMMTTRVQYALHRRGLEWRSMGADVMCGGEMAAFLPKTMYRHQLFHPIAETSDNHVIGDTELKWGLGRTIPAVGEDPIYIVWRWVDCCNTNN